MSVPDKQSLSLEAAAGRFFYNLPTHCLSPDDLSKFTYTEYADLLPKKYGVLLQAGVASGKLYDIDDRDSPQCEAVITLIFDGRLDHYAYNDWEVTLATLIGDRKRQVLQARTFLGRYLYYNYHFDEQGRMNDGSVSTVDENIWSLIGALLSQGVFTNHVSNLREKKRQAVASVEEYRAKYYGRIAPKKFEEEIKKRTDRADNMGFVALGFQVYPTITSS